MLCYNPTTSGPWNAIYVSQDINSRLLILSPILGFIMFNLLCPYILLYKKLLNQSKLHNDSSSLSCWIFHNCFIPNILLKALFVSHTIFTVSISFWAIAVLTSSEYPDKTITNIMIYNLLKTIAIIPLLTWLSLPSQFGHSLEGLCFQWFSLVRDMRSQPACRCGQGCNEWGGTSNPTLFSET